MKLFGWLSQKASNQKSRIKSFSRKITSADELERNGQYIIGMAKDLAKNKESRNESFASAYKRLNLDEKKLAETYNYFSLRFYIFVFFLIIGLFIGVLYLFTKPWAALAALGFILYCLANMFVCSFRMFQIRKRELFPVSYWTAFPSEWWPKEFKPLKKPSSKKNEKLPDNVKKLHDGSSPRRSLKNKNEE